MKKFYTCDACRYTFTYDGDCEQCPDCGKIAIRLATVSKQSEYLRIIKEINDPANMRRYVRVALENGDMAWYLDETGTLIEGNFVKLSYGTRETRGEIIEIRNCSMYDSPCFGSAKPVIKRL